MVLKKSVAIVESTTVVLVLLQVPLLVPAKANTPGDDAFYRLQEWQNPPPPLEVVVAVFVIDCMKHFYD
jgi:hypothetical protein